LTPQEEQEAEATRWPRFFLKQLTTPDEHSTLRERIGRIFSKKLGRYSCDRNGKFNDPLVLEAVSKAYVWLQKNEGEGLRVSLNALRRCANDSVSWGEKAVDALAKYVSGMTDGVVREVLEEKEAVKGPRGRKVVDMGLVSGAGTLTDINARWRLSQDLLKIGVRPLDLEVHHANEDQLTNLLFTLSDSMAQTPETILIEKENESEELERKELEPLNFEFLEQEWESKSPQQKELLTVLVRECRNPETAKLLYKTDGKSKSLDHERVRILTGWEKKKVQKEIHDLFEANYDRTGKRSEELARRFAAFVAARKTSQTKTSSPFEAIEGAEVSDTSQTKP
jgi:hypothetical protein